MSGVLRVACLNCLLGAQVNGDGNDRQDADVPETGRETVSKRGDYRTCWGLTVNICKRNQEKNSIIDPSSDFVF